MRAQNEQLVEHTPEKATQSLWAPMREPLFASLWLAMLVSTTGTWMHETGAGWLMTSLTPSPSVVVLVQTANTLPIFLFALLAGALADRMDKRRFLITTNVVLACIVLAFSGLVSLGTVTPATLVAFTFLIGTGAAFSAPAWQALVPDLVSGSNLRNALALNSLGINISRAIGPAIAGFLIAAIGMSAPFLVNAASYLVVVVVLVLWRQERPVDSASDKHVEPLVSAMGVGLRHTLNNLPLRQTILRASAFFIAASSLWSLLPLVARALPNATASLFGAMTACIGAGAVFGALMLPRLRERWDTNQIALGSAVLMTLVIPVLGSVQKQTLVFVVCALAGVAWIASLTLFNLSAQTALPAWVRARGLSIFLMAFFGSMTAGSLMWGQGAGHLGVPTAMVMSGVVLAALTMVTRKIPLGSAETMDLSPSMHWPAPTLILDEGEQDETGPVMITIEYSVDKQHAKTFKTLMRALRAERYRDGAYDWGLHRSSEDTDVWLEWFLVGSWKEHLRQHQRVSKEDQKLQVQIRDLTQSSDAPRVRHWIAPRF